MNNASILRALRFELGNQRNIQNLTYDDLSKLSGVGRRTLVSIGSGESNGSIETWIDISRALNYKFSTFIEMAERSTS
jgi:DNA-binding XRE family transcriptional regulator